MLRIAIKIICAAAEPAAALVWWRLRLALSTKKSFEEIADVPAAAAAQRVARAMTRWPESAQPGPVRPASGSTSGVAPAVAICASCALAGIGAFFILAAEIASSVAH